MFRKTRHLCAVASSGHAFAAACAATMASEAAAAQRASLVSPFHGVPVVRQQIRARRNGANS